MTIVYGPKYNKELTRPEIAKCVRADVAAAIKSGELPKGLKVSVRCQSYSGGGSIHMTVTAVPAGFEVWNPERVAWDLASRHGSGERMPSLRTAAAEELLKKLEEMLNAYNYDGSDPVSDYYNVRFYGGAEFSGALERASRESWEAVYKTLPPPPNAAANDNAA